MSFNTIAFGGIRIVGPGDSASGNDPLGMPERYFLKREYRSDGDSEHARKAAGEWDTGIYAPDYIVLNLGTNDVSGSSSFTDDYTAFLKKLKSTYPGAKLFVMTPFNGNMKAGVRFAAEAAADPDVILIDTGAWNIKGGADGLHPDPDAHETAAELLYNVLKPYIEKDLEPSASPAAAGDDADNTPGADGEHGNTAEPAKDPDADNTKKRSRLSGIILPLSISGGIVLASALAVIIVYSRGRKKS